MNYIFFKLMKGTYSDKKYYSKLFLTLIEAFTLSPMLHIASRLLRIEGNSQINIFTISGLLILVFNQWYYSDSRIKSIEEKYSNRFGNISFKSEIRLWSIIFCLILIFLFGDDWGKNALVAGRKGALIGAASGALISGMFAGITGRNIWTGAQPTARSSIFSLKDAFRGQRAPSFNFKDAYSLRAKNFWKYGHTNMQKVMYEQNSSGELVEATGTTDFMNGKSGVTSNQQYAVTGNTVANPDGTFTTTITKQPYQIISDPIGAFPQNAAILSSNVSDNIITITTLNQASFFTVGGQIPAGYGNGFYSFFQIGW